VITSSEANSHPDAAVGKLLQMLWRRKVVLIIPTALGVALGAAGYAHAPSRYVSEAILALDVRQFQGLPSQAVISPLPQESPVLRTELDIIRSRTMAELVIDRLAKQGIVLSADKPQADFLQDAKSAVMQYLPRPAGPEKGLIDDASTEEHRVEINTLLSNLSVANDSHSYTIFISYADGNPTRAALVANAFASAYIDHQVDIQTTATQTVSQWLGKRVDNLRKELELSERARAEYRQEAGIVEFDGVTLQAHRVAALDGELVNNRASLAGAQARLETARKLASDPHGLTLVEVLNSSSIQTLRVEQARLERAVTTIEDGGATKSSELPSLRSQIASVKGQIADETQRVIDSLANEVEVLQTKDSSIRAALKDAQGALSMTSNALLRATELDREATANRDIYDSYLTRYKQTVEQEGIATPEARLISQAEPAGARSSPSLPLWLMVGFFGGAALGTAGMLWRQLTDKRIWSTGELETTVGIPVLGRVISSSRKRFGRGGRSYSGHQQSLAALQAVLRSGAATRKARTMVIASALGGEGKTMLVAGLARSMATSGSKVLAIDLNMLQPNLAAAFNMRPQIFLDEAISNDGTHRNVVLSDPESGVDIIASRQASFPPELLIDTKGFGQLMASLRQRYDVILIDTPATTQSRVALQLASQSDLALLVVNIAHTSMDAVVRAFHILSASGQPPVGLVVTTVSKTKSKHAYREPKSGQPGAARPTPVGELPGPAAAAPA
jgi:uncharacterized protein involved in exopolysaccharide biosynthesis/Mrp family chromosome partitioning ATPase